MPVGNCPNESAIQKYTTSSNSKAVARLIEVENPTSITKDKTVLKDKIPTYRKPKQRPSNQEVSAALA